jgi:hypothetical protein
MPLDRRKAEEDMHVAFVQEPPGAGAGSSTRFLAVSTLLVLIAGCHAATEPTNRVANGSEAATAPATNAVAPAPETNAAVPAPGTNTAAATPASAVPTPGTTPTAADVPASDKTPQAAVNVVQRYYAFIEARAYGEARRLWDRGGDASGKSKAGFAAYRDYHGEVGAPGRIEGAAGSSFIEVPVRISGLRADGTAFRQSATVTLRRVNDVPGSTAEQRRWHISEIDLGMDTQD